MIILFPMKTLQEGLMKCFATVLSTHIQDALHANFW